MKKIESFTKETVQKIDNEIQEAVKAVAEKYGINIDVKIKKFNIRQFSGSIEASTVSSGGLTATQKIYQDMADNPVFNLPSVNEEFDFHGETFKVVDYKTRNRKYPVIAEKISDGGLYKLNVYDIEKVYAAPEKTEA